MRAVQPFGTEVGTAYHDGDPISESVPPAAFFNVHNTELMALVTGAGLTPSTDDSDLGQVLRAVRELIQQQTGNYGIDTGAVNAYVVALSPAVTAYTAGLTVRFKVAHAATGASTLDAGAGPAPLVREDETATQTGDIPAGGIVTVIYDAASAKFVMSGAAVAALNIIAHDGAPSGNCAGTQGTSYVFDTVHLTLSVCTTTGTASTATWQVVGAMAPVTLASAATTDLGTASSTTVNVSGTTTITSFGASAPIGLIYTLIFGGALTLTYNAASLILPTAANIVTAAGDVMQIVQTASGVWKCIDYQRANGQAISPGGSTGYYRNLAITVTGNAALTASADLITLSNTAGATLNESLSATVSTGSTGLNGLDTGTTLSGTAQFLKIWAVSNGATTGVVLSVESQTAPSATTLTTYPYYAYIGRVRVNSSNYLFRSKQLGADVQYIVDGTVLTTPPVAASGAVGTWSQTAPTWAAASLAGIIPSNASRVRGFASNCSTASYGNGYVAPSSAYSGWETTNPPPVYLNYAYAQVWPFDFLLESMSLSVVGGSSNFLVEILGWRDGSL